MKKTKGFTLIELLAVIVILAIIALIATPLLMNVINDAKKGAARNSAYAYIKAYEQHLALEMATTGKSPVAEAASTVVTDINATIVKSSKPSLLNLVLAKGTVQDNSTITVDTFEFTLTNGELK